MQSQHALRTSEDPVTLLRYLDLVVLALALPVFIFAGLPLLGYAAAAVAWLVQRGIRELLNRRARASDDPRTVAGLLAGSMIIRGWLAALAIFGVGLADRDAGLSAAVLVIALFTVFLSGEMLARPFEAGGGRR
jgi:MFS-type transporter involved in bile tolerance (Atg22 family)